MAQGGDVQYYPDIDPDEDINPNEVQETLNSTQRFTSGESSTPYHGGEEYQMQTMQKEQSWGPPSYQETSFGGDERAPLLPDLESRLDKLKRNSLTGVLDISANPSGENLLSLEEQKKEIENAKRFIKIVTPMLILKNWGRSFFLKKTLLRLLFSDREAASRPSF